LYTGNKNLCDLVTYDPDMQYTSGDMCSRRARLSWHGWMLQKLSTLSALCIQWHRH